LFIALRVSVAQLIHKGATTMRGLSAAIASAIFLSGCAYDAKPISTGAVNIVSNHSQKAPGRYALYVDPGELNKVIHPRGTNCAAHSYPLNMTDGFKSSVRATLANIFDQVEDVPTPLQGQTLRTAGYRGQIIVRGESMEGRLIAVPGFWNATISTTIQLAASITVDGPDGRLVGKTLEGMAERESDAGALCSGGAASVEDAATEAMRKLMVQLGETVANTDKLYLASR
jgi:hypothetical protein